MPYLVPPLLPRGRMRRAAQPVLRTNDGLVLRLWHPADAPAVLRAYRDPDVVHWNLRSLRTTAEALEWIAQWGARWRAEADACWAVADSRDRVLGRIALRDIDLAGGHAQCTYWVLPEARGCGVAARASIAVARWALGDLGLHRLELRHSTRNAASCRAATKAGFGAEGTLRDGLMHSDGWHDMHLHGLVAGTPAAVAVGVGPGGTPA